MTSFPNKVRSLICSSPGKMEYGFSDLPHPAAGQATLRIRRIGICGTDLHAFEGTQPYFSYPRILGHELCGELLDTGGAAGFSRGDLVTILPYFNCGRCHACLQGKTNCCSGLQVCGVHVDGGMREYFSLPSQFLVAGGHLSADSLALIEPLAIGAHAIRRSKVNKGDNLLVVGAGPIGLGIMAFGRIAGARVIALDTQDKRLAIARERLGVEWTHNPLKGPTRQFLAELTDGEMPQVVIDATGNLGAIQDSFEFMAHGGKYMLVGLQKQPIAFSHPEFHKREGTLMSSRNATRSDFDFVMDCMSKGWVEPTNFITHRVAFDLAVSKFKEWLDPATGVIKAMVSLD